VTFEYEPAIPTSAPPDQDVPDALFTAGEISALKLGMEVVILSTCTTGGPGAAEGAKFNQDLRAQFFIGARSMLVTHRSVNDRDISVPDPASIKQSDGADGRGFAAVAVGPDDGGRCYRTFALLRVGSHLLGRDEPHAPVMRHNRRRPISVPAER
jgi:hypothetical protein